MTVLLMFMGLICYEAVVNKRVSGRLHCVLYSHEQAVPAGLSGYSPRGAVGAIM